MAGSVLASLDLTQPKPPPLEMPGVCCQAPLACIPHWPWAGEQLGAPSPPKSRRLPLAPRHPVLPYVCRCSAVCLLLLGGARAPPAPGGVIASASQPRGSQSSV